MVIKSTCCAVLTSDQRNTCFLIPGLAPSHKKHKADAVLQQGQGYQRDVIDGWWLCFRDTSALLITKDSWPRFLIDLGISTAESELSLEKYRHVQCLGLWFALRLFDVDATDSGISEGKGAKASSQGHRLEMQTRCSQLFNDFPSGKKRWRIDFKSASK